MKTAQYFLETHHRHGQIKVKPFIGTRAEARKACREIDTDTNGARKQFQATHVVFFRYEPENAK